jgi:hypothetical protein
MQNVGPAICSSQRLLLMMLACTPSKQRVQHPDVKLMTAQADSFRPLDVVGLDGAAGLCSGLRTGHPNFFRQRMAAFVRGRLWSSSATGTQEECESPSLLQIMAERSLLGCLLGLALLMASLFLPRSQLAELVCPLS